MGWSPRHQTPAGFPALPGARALAVIILATTSRAWTSMVQMVMIFILSPALRFPTSRLMSAFS